MQPFTPGVETQHGPVPPPVELEELAAELDEALPPLPELEEDAVVVVEPDPAVLLVSWPPVFEEPPLPPIPELVEAVEVDDETSPPVAPSVLAESCPPDPLEELVSGKTLHVSPRFWLSHSVNAKSSENGAPPHDESTTIRKIRARLTTFSS